MVLIPGADFDIPEGNDAVVDLEGDGREAAGLATEGDLAFGALAEGEGGFGGGGIEIHVDDFLTIEPVFDVEAVGDDAGMVPEVGGGGDGPSGSDVVVEGGAGVAGGGEGVGVREIVGDLVFKAAGFEAGFMGDGLDAVFDPGVRAGGGVPGERKFEVGEFALGKEVDLLALVRGGNEGTVHDGPRGRGGGGFAGPAPAGEGGSIEEELPAGLGFGGREGVGLGGEERGKKEAEQKAEEGGAHGR